MDRTGNAFPVDQFENKDLLVICGGTGMSPVKTTLTHFYDHPEICKSVYLIAGFKDINCVLFNEERAKFAERSTVRTVWTTPRHLDSTKDW